MLSNDVFAMTNMFLKQPTSRNSALAENQGMH